MKRIGFFWGFITLLVLCCAFTAEAKDYENGSDVYRYGDTEFYSNIEDEDKLYKINLIDMSEEKLLEDHIISIIGKEDRLYLLVYNNGKSNLMCYNSSNGEYKLLEAFNNLITNISMQNDIFYFIQDKNIMSYDGDSITYVIGNGDVDLMFFTENNILKYYSQSQIGEYVEHTYTFNLSTTDTNITQNANTLKLMSTSSYSPRLTEPSTDNAYYTSWNVFHTSGYGMLDYSGNKRGNCTCYAYGRSYENLGTKPNLSTSNAENWYNYNRNNGYYLYGSTPELGAVVVWGKGIIGNSDDGAGHVAVVEVISGDTVITSESGWKSFYFKTVPRSASHSNFSAASSYTLQGFIYVMGSSPITTDTEAPVVSRAYTSNVSGNSFTINCDVYDNVAVTRAYIIVWGPGGNSGNGFNIDVFNNFNYTINTSDYGGAGTYTVHVYIFDAAGNSASAAINDIQAVSDTENPVISRLYTSNVNGDSFTINCDVYDNVAVTRAYIIVWGPGGNSGNGFSIDVFNNFSYTIKTSDYGGKGLYSVHVYVYDAQGNGTSAAVNDIQAVSDSETPVICDLRVSNVSSSSFTINCDVYDNVAVTRAYIIVWGPGGNSGNGFSIDVFNNFSYTINTSDYGGRGLYSVHVYVFDKEGNESHGAGLSNIEAVSDSEAPVMCSFYPSNISSKQFTINCDVYDNIAVTRAYIIVWGPGGNSGNGFSIDVFNNFNYTINTSDYGGAGKYSVHVYLFDADGNQTGAALNNLTIGDDSIAPEITNLEVTNVSDKSFTINCTANETIVRGWVNIYGPSKSDGYAVSMYGTSFMHTINTESYGGAGDYEVHVYIWDMNGNEGAGKSTGKFKAAKIYTIKYDANGGTDSPAAQTKYQDQTLVLTDSMLTRQGYVFKGWSEDKTATSATWVAGSNFNENRNTTLYACWQSENYTLSFNPNGGTVETTEKQVTYNDKYGDLPKPTREGYNFRGWYTEAGEGSMITATDTVNVTSDQILYAHWEATTYRVIYDTNGGNEGSWSEIYNYDEHGIVTAVVPTRDGYIFLGWAKNAFTEHEELYSNNSIFNDNKDIILYATWKLEPSITARVIDKDKYSLIDVVIHNADIGNQVIIATYLDNRLMSVQFETYTGMDISIATVDEHDTIKVMLWNDISSMKPLCEAVYSK